MCVTTKSPKVWLKTRIFVFGVAFYICVAGNRRHFKFGTEVEHSMSQSTDYKLSLKGAWLLSRDFFNFWKISNNRPILKTVQGSLVSIRFQKEVAYALYRMVMLPLTLDGL